MQAVHISKRQAESKTQSRNNYVYNQARVIQPWKLHCALLRRQEHCNMTGNLLPLSTFLPFVALLPYPYPAEKKNDRKQLQALPSHLPNSPVRVCRVAISH